MFRLPRLVGISALVLLAAAAVLWLAPSSSYLFLPDPARPVDPLVSVPNETAGDANGDGGGVYMVDVNVRRARLFERLFPQIHEGAEVVPEDVFNPGGVSDQERRRQSLNEMSASQKIAVAVALRELGREVDETGAEVVSVRVDSPADGVLEPGDVVVRANGQEIATPEDLFEAMQGHTPGDPVEVTVRRGDRTLDVEVGTTAAPDDPNRAIMGITVEPQFHFPVDVHIDAGNIGGPSAGLAFALDVVDELGRDVDGGRVVAVTGTLALDGTVGAIGGVEQKTIGAREAGADVFLVPDANAAEARAAADGLEIVPVSTFDEALSYLTTR